MTRRPLPSLKGLQAFEVFARTGSMTRAAAELSVTHGAVSRQIKALEAQLGARLVDGPKHQLQLTPAGRELASSLSTAFDLVASALPGAAADQELVVACPGTFAMKWLIPRLPRYLGLARAFAFASSRTALATSVAAACRPPSPFSAAPRRRACGRRHS